jgi:nitrate reductase gamma subunit
MTLLQLLTYISLVIFLIGMVRTALKYLRMPIHLRWELYPVAHEKGRDYGGSYFEDMDWWTKPREKSLLNELKFMVPEILLIRALYHHNRKLWTVSFPFHGGLYLLVGLLCLLLTGAVALALGVKVSPHSSHWLFTLLY